MLRLLKLLPLCAVLALLASCGEDEPAAGGNGVDRAFAAEMVPHHESAIDMAVFAERRAKTRDVRRLAGAISHLQDEEIIVLRREDQQLAREGVQRGELGVPSHMMGMDDDPAALRTAEDVDRAFLEMMIPHHEGAIAMARAELAKGTDPELRDLAQRIVTAQERELTVMRAELARLGDAGGSAAPPPADAGEPHGHG